MKSRYVDQFNHDADAPDYDQDVLNEADPIRAGYAALLDWVARAAAIGPASMVVDLGAGTGNLTARLLAARRLVEVDVSAAMLRMARDKLGAADNLDFVQADLLEFFDTPRGPFDAVVSSYAIHHLDSDEKALLFERIRWALKPDGVAVFGDLMFESRAQRAQYLDTCRRSGRDDLAQDIEAEFFWDIEEQSRMLRDLGFTIETHRFSDLSWGIAARAVEST